MTNAGSSCMCMCYFKDNNLSIFTEIELKKQVPGVLHAMQCVEDLVLPNLHQPVLPAIISGPVPAPAPAPELGPLAENHLQDSVHTLVFHHFSQPVLPISVLLLLPVVKLHIPGIQKCLAAPRHLHQFLKCAQLVAFTTDSKLAVFNLHSPAPTGC